MADNTTKDNMSSPFARNNNLGELRLRHEETNEIILIPTPTNDPNDPLNWSKAYRLYIAILVSCAIFFSNFLAAGPSVAIVSITESFFGPPGPEFNHQLAKTAYFFTTTALLQGMGNLIWVPLIAKFGRRPIYVTSFVLYTGVAGWAGAATTYGSSLAARIFLGVASGASECLAPLTISDLFFLHERGAIMAIYTTALSAGVAFGVIIAGLITIDLDWRYIYWVTLALIGTCTLLIIFTFPETIYHRNGSPDENEMATADHHNTAHTQPTKDETMDTEVGHSSDVGSNQFSTNSFAPKRTYWQSLSLYSGVHTQESFLKLVFRPVVLLSLPPVLWATLVMSVTIGFLVAITSNFAVAYSNTYGFKPWQAGLCFVACLVGSGIGSFFGGRFSDMVADKLTRGNNGIRRPEMRLPAMMISVFTAPLALVLYGVGIDRAWHWIVPTIGLGLLNFSIVQATNITLVYTIDSYRPVAGELSVTQFAFKSAFGFLLSFYTNPWIDSSGYSNAFGAMAGISGSILVLWIPMYVWGQRIRQATWSWGFIESLVHWHKDHLQDKPFRCQVCNKAFGRQDLLKRHAAGHNTNEPGSKRQKRTSNSAPRVSQACRACAAAKLKCDDDVSCRRCVGKGIACEREARNANVVETPVSTDSVQSMIVAREPSIPLFEPHVHLPVSDKDFSSFLKGVMTPLEGQQGQSLDQVDLSAFDSTFDPLRSHGILDFRADVDTRFDDVAMGLWDLPCSPSFYYNGIVFEPKADPAVIHEPQQPKLIADDSPVALGRAAYKESALGVWEPSPRDDLNSNIKALSVLGESPQSAIEMAGLEATNCQQFSPLSVSLRDQMLLLSLDACKPQSKFAIIRAFPSPEILSKLIESFFSHHRVQIDSWLHGPSFEPNQQGPEFILAIVNAGTTFADNKILHSLGFALHEVVRLSLPNMFEAANSITRSLGALQAFVLDIEMGLWSGIKRKMEIAESQRQIPFTMLRRSGRFGKACERAAAPVAEDTGGTLHDKWLAWIEQESYNRTAYHSFIMDTQLSISMLTCPLISFSELKTPFPESRDLWLAADAETWKTLYLSEERQHSRISLADYFRDSAEIDSTYDTQFCQLIILSGIWGMVWQCLQTIAILDKPSHSDPALTLRHQEILQILHRVRVNIPEEKVGQDGPVDMLYELINMHLHMPFGEVELFAGKGDQNDARRALPLLSDWTSRREARKAIWHAGQLMRAAEKLEPGRLRGFYTIALYQANLAMWAYAVVSQVNGTDKDVSMRTQEVVFLNTSDTMLVQRFINKGSPSQAAIQPCVARGNTAPISLMDQRGVVDHVLGILGANFSRCQTMPPLVENLQQLLGKLGRAATNVSS
ncbi:transcription factor Pig1p [Fusarium beomiforme]|uniref:Transcription factor Pig1p n=1 Tax=Fusarium beomiforme TaxID=44412 RepID=A0A9P5DRB4_9HYPO|nr:transcription factor Pig1p [Fusarium beomiforme]